MQQIADWLEKLGLSEYAQRFAENDIDFTILGDLTDQDLEKIGIASLGHRRKLLRSARMDPDRRRGQLTKAPDYGSVLVAVTLAQFYLSGMLQRTLPAGFIAPCFNQNPTSCPPAPNGCTRSRTMAFGLPAQLFTGSLWRAARPGHPKWGA